MGFSSVVDWLTLSWRNDKDLSEILPDNDQFKIEQELSGNKIYNSVYKLVCGGILGVSNSIEQGIRLDLSGQPLAALRASGFGMMDQIRLAVNARRVTRIDYALDIKDEHKRYCPEAVLVAYKRGKIKTRMTPNRMILNLKSNGGRSVYWGGETSDNQIRIYDKAREMNLLYQAWCRVEMQTRGRSADALVYDMSVEGINRAAKAKLRKIFKSNDDFWLADIVKDNDIKLTKIARKQTSFESWIEKTIGPAFEKHMLIHDDKKLILALCNQMFDIAQDQDYY